MNKKRIIKATKSYREELVKLLQEPDEAAHYLKAALDEYESDNNMQAFLLALRTVIEARGGISKLAKKTNLNRQNLYKTLSSSGNPRLSTLGAILHNLGFRLSIEPYNKSFDDSDGGT